MAPSRRLSNGRSPLVNQQRQITSFFSKPASSSPITPNQNPTKLASSTKSGPKSKPKPSCSPSPSPSTPSPLQSKLQKPILVIGGASSPSLSPLTPATVEIQGDEVVGKRIKVYWPLDKSWYEGFVKSFDRDSRKHLVQYDDGEEESLDLAKEKIEWIEQSVRKFKRLRRGGSSLSVEKMVIDDELENLEDEEEDNSDDFSDEDWEKSGEKEGIEDSDENEVVELDDEREENEASRSKGRRGGKGESRKRKVAREEERAGSAKKNKGREDASKGGFKLSLVEPTNYNAESK